MGGGGGDHGCLIDRYYLIRFVVRVHKIIDIDKKKMEGKKRKEIFEIGSNSDQVLRIFSLYLRRIFVLDYERA